MTTAYETTLINNSYLQERKTFSQQKLNDLRKKFQQIDCPDNMVIIATGSFAREEACPSSDIDLAFIEYTDQLESNMGHLAQIRLFADVIEIIEMMNFPSPSNDGEFLKVHTVKSLIENLGSSFDDHSNAFTTRLLLLLESRPLINDVLYKKILITVLEEYLRDKTDHQEDFKPVFLLNDLLRFWRTLCLNYENNRSQGSAKTKIRNIKLKFSRLLTFYSMMLTLVTWPSNTSYDPQTLLYKVELSPWFRIMTVLATGNNPNLLTQWSQAIDDYVIFLRSVCDNTIEKQYTNLWQQANCFSTNLYTIFQKVVRRDLERFVVL